MLLICIVNMIIRCIRPWIKCVTHSAINDPGAGRGPHALGRTVLQKTGVGTGISKISFKQTNTVKFELTNLVLKSIDEDSKLHVHLQKYLLFAKTWDIKSSWTHMFKWFDAAPKESKYQWSNWVRSCHDWCLSALSTSQTSIRSLCSELNLPDITTVLFIQFQPLELTKNHQTK